MRVSSHDSKGFASDLTVAVVWLTLYGMMLFGSFRPVPLATVVAWTGLN